METLGKKTTLAMAVFGAIYSFPVLSATYDDNCSFYEYVYNGFSYGKTYTCTLADPADNSLNLAGANLDGLRELEFENNEAGTSYIIKNFALSDGNIYEHYEYTGDDDSNDAYTLSPLIHFFSHDEGTFKLDSWNINISKQIHELINIDISLVNDIDYIAMNNASISANADTIFSTLDVRADDPQDGYNYQLLTINNSSITNTKQHVNFIATKDDYYPTINSSMGSIIQLGSLYEYDDEQAIIVNINFNNSDLNAETLVSLGLAEAGQDVDEVRSSAYHLNLSNTTGKFDNLVSRSGGFESEGIFQTDNVVINLDNSTVSSGIYAEINGGYRHKRTTLNLANNSTFNYLGGCTENCNDYLILESEGGVTQPDHASYSYIHAVNMSDNSTFNFSSEGDFKQLHVDEMTSDGTATIVMNTDLSTMRGDFLFLTKADGYFNVQVNDQGGEPNTDSYLALISVEQSGTSEFELNYGNGVDVGAYVYDIKRIAYANGQSLWFLDPTLREDNNVDCPVCPPVVLPPDSSDKPKTSPSTDAVLSMSSAAQFILNDELQNLRMRRGDVMQNNADSANVWGRLVGHRLNVSGPESSAYKLNRSGMELGGDKLFHLGNDRLVVGVTGMLSDNKVKHARGGSSNIDAYSVGAYATYLTDSNFYLDGTVKYIHFNNELKAISTNGSVVTSDYKQHGFGGALEFGYKHQQNDWFVEPYGRMSYSEVSGKSIALSNGMKATLDDHKSLLGEVGASTGFKFKPSDNMIVEPYFKVAVEHEFMKNNDVLINGVHQFKNDFSGTAGKYGVGVNVALGQNTSIYSEVNYVKGRNIESPVTANVGFRISF